MPCTRFFYGGGTLPDRDLRDPAEIGTLLTMWREEYPDTPMHEMANDLANIILSDYSHSESTVQQTVRSYRDELTQRILGGDRNAYEVFVHHFPDDVDALLGALREEARLDGIGHPLMVSDANTRLTTRVTSRCPDGHALANGTTYCSTCDRWY